MLTVALINLADQRQQREETINRQSKFSASPCGYCFCSMLTWNSRFT